MCVQSLSVSISATARLIVNSSCNKAMAIKSERAFKKKGTHFFPETFCSLQLLQPLQNIGKAANKIVLWICLSDKWLCNNIFLIQIVGLVLFEFSGSKPMPNLEL